MRAAGLPPISTVGVPGPMIGPPTAEVTQGDRGRLVEQAVGVEQRAARVKFGRVAVGTAELLGAADTGNPERRGPRGYRDRQEIYCVIHFYPRAAFLIDRFRPVEWPPDRYSYFSESLHSMK